MNPTFSLGGEGSIDFIGIILAPGLESILRPGTPIEFRDEISSECSVIEKGSQPIHEFTILFIAVYAKEIG